MRRKFSVLNLKCTFCRFTSPVSKLAVRTSNLLLTSSHAIQLIHLSNFSVNISNKPVGPKSSDSPEAPTSTAIQDLATKFFLSTSKRYYFDIKEQNGVRFVKISEISSMDQSRNLISINLNLVAKFRDVLDELQHRPMPPYRTDKSGTSLLHSVSIVKDTRRYLIDLKRNRWGYFIMVSKSNREREWETKRKND